MNNEILYIDSENKKPCSSRIADIKEFLQVDIRTPFIEIITPNQQEVECMHRVMLSSYLIAVHNSYKNINWNAIFYYNSSDNVFETGYAISLFNIGCLINQDFPNFEPNIFHAQIRANSESVINTIPRNNMTMISPTQSLNCPQTIS